MSLVPGQGAYNKQPINVSLSHGCFSPSPSLPLYLKNVNKHVLRGEEIHITKYACIGLKLSFLVASMSGFGIRVILALQNELGSVSSSSTFGKILIRII